MMGCQQALTTKRVWLSLVKCSATECASDKSVNKSVNRC